MKKIFTILISVIFIIFCSGCSKDMNDQNEEEELQLKETYANQDKLVEQFV